MRKLLLTLSASALLSLGAGCSPRATEKPLPSLPSGTATPAPGGATPEAHEAHSLIVRLLARQREIDAELAQTGAYPNNAELARMRAARSGKDAEALAAAWQELNQKEITELTRLEQSLAQLRTAAAAQASAQSLAATQAAGLFGSGFSWQQGVFGGSILLTALGVAALVGGYAGRRWARQAVAQALTDAGLW